MRRIHQIIGGDVNAIKSCIKKSRPFANIVHKYFLDSNEADIVVQKLKNVQDSFVFELRPGAAVLSQAFLRAGCPKVFALETNPHFTDVLQELEKIYPDRFYARVEKSLQQISWDPLNFGEHFIHSENDIKRVDWNSDKLFARVVCFEPKAKGEGSSVIKWIEHVLFRSGLLSWGRCELAVCMAKQRAERLTSPGGIYGSKPPLLNLLCDVEILHSIPRAAHLPSYKTKHPEQLVSIIPKKDPGIRVPDQEVANVLYFMKLLFNRPSRPLSFHLNILVQDKDTFLNKLGLDKDLKPKDMTSDQLLTLINEYFHWEERNDFLLRDHLL